MAETTMCRPRACWPAAMPLTAKLLASLPLAVKWISEAEAPIRAATSSRAASTAASASRPAACRLWGLPNESVRKGLMASKTSGRRGVAAI